MSVETQEYINGMREGPLTREIPECMRDKYTVVQTVLDIIWFALIVIGHVIRVIYRSIVGVPKKDLKGGIAVVTGGGGGLGSLIALRLARLGCKVVLWDINKQGELLLLITALHTITYVLITISKNYLTTCLPDKPACVIQMREMYIKADMDIMSTYGFTMTLAVCAMLPALFSVKRCLGILSNLLTNRVVS